MIKKSKCFLTFVTNYCSITSYQRIKKILFALIMIIVAVILLTLDDNDGLETVLFILTLGFAIKGIKDIIFYFTMARHMVGGKMILFLGVVVLDFAMFTGSLSGVPQIYVMVYLISIHAFSGAVEVLRAMEAKRTVEGPWKVKLSHGIVNIVLALLCLVFIMNTATAVMIYSVGLLYSAIIRIISAFRRTSFLLIR